MNTMLLAQLAEYQIHLKEAKVISDAIKQKYGHTAITITILHYLDGHTESNLSAIIDAVGLHYDVVRATVGRHISLGNIARKKGFLSLTTAGKVFFAELDKTTN